MSATEQDFPVSPPEVYAECKYDMGVLWTEIDMKQEWPTKVLSTKVALYPWPHGMPALIAERQNVARIEALRLNFERGQLVNPGKSIGSATRIFTMPLSFNEAFVGSDMQRIKLMDIVRNYMNFEWKCDAKAEIQLSRKASKKADGSRITSPVYHEVREWEFERQFGTLLRDAEELFGKRIEDVILLQGLTQELKPETLELIKRCKSHEQLVRCMLDAKYASM